MSPSSNPSRVATTGLTLALVFCFLFTTSGLPQTSELVRAERLRAATQLLDDSADVDTAPLEAPVDPETYRLVPGDRLLVGIWGDRPESYRTVVTPDGHLVVPDLLAVDVRNLTLVEARAAARAALAPLYPKKPVALHLLGLGSFRVAITGAVAKPGYYDLTGTQRLSDLLREAEGVRKEASLRRIQIRSNDDALADLAPAPGGAPAQTVDHAGWYLRGDLESNPHLRPGDRVEVPTLVSYVEVAGAVGGAPGILEEDDEIVRQEVNRPEDPERLRIEWMPGDRVRDVLAMAGGLDDEASGHAVLVTSEGMRTELDLFDPSDLDRDVPAFSKLQVAQEDHWIYVIGSVRTPGRYPYVPGLAPRGYVLLAGGETENGRSSGWKVVDREGHSRSVDQVVLLEPGSTVRVPERRSYWISRVLAPLSSAAALTFSVVALLDRR
ncbi:MAG: SLBB domain-containing protein [Candidatus Eisenbacteria bacterium]